MLEKLQELLRQKKSKAFYADKLGITIKEVEELLTELRGEEGKVEADLSIEGSTQRYNFDKGEVEVSSTYDHPPTSDEVIKDHKIDITKYKLSAFYSKGVSGGWKVTALFKNITKEEEVVSDFQEFLKTYKSNYSPIKPPVGTWYNKGALIVNKQDFHANKKDEYYGDNNIFHRFDQYELLLSETVERAKKLVDLEHVTYIIGSDHFNSEITGATVKGTPQSNIHSYQTSFQLVCDHEVKVVEYLLESSKEVNVIYLVGNHDLCVSFHMASWLKVYFRNESRVNIDISGDFTKYFSLFDTAICVNHGDVQKPERLAQNFPLEYKDGFAKADHHIILTGDRHTELSRDIGGIKFYQIPALSKARGTWDKQMGYTTTHAQMTSFLIEPGEGVSAILKKEIRNE